MTAAAELTRDSQSRLTLHPPRLPCTATRGYDLASGLGTLDAARFVPALAAAPGGGFDH
jgi:hypothetical protein